MDLPLIIEFFTKYVVVPLCTIICSMGWRMFKKQDERMRCLEIKMHETEKSVLELKTEIRKDIQYIASDIKDIKLLLKSLK